MHQLLQTLRLRYSNLKNALEEECQCPPEVQRPKYKDPKKQTARIGCEKRKKGKMVTVIRGLAAADNDLPALCKQLKNSCGAGGTVVDDTVEIQGDHIERIREALIQVGYRVR